MTRIISPENTSTIVLEPSVSNVEKVNLTTAERSLNRGRSAIIMPEVAELSPISYVPVHGSSESVVITPRIIKPMFDSLPSVEKNELVSPKPPVVEKSKPAAYAPKISVVKTEATTNSPTTITEFTPVVSITAPVKAKFVKLTTDRPTNHKQARKANRKTTVVPDEVVKPVVEVKNTTGPNKAQKISMIGGLGLAGLTGGRLVFKSRRTADQKSHVVTPTPENEPIVVPDVATAQAGSKPLSQSLRDSPMALAIYAKNRFTELNEKAADRKGMIAGAIGTVLVAGLAYAAYKGFQTNPAEQADLVVQPNGKAAAQAAAEQATVPHTFDNPGVNPEGGGVSTTAIGTEPAALAPTAETAQSIETVGTEVAVADGAGFTDVYVDTAAELYDTDLTGQEAYNIDQQMQAKFNGNILNVESYQMSNGDYGITSPGITSWNPDAQRFFEDLLEETAKKKKTS